MVDDLHRIGRGEVLEHGHDDRSIGDDSEEEDRPLGGILAHQGDLIAVL